MGITYGIHRKSSLEFMTNEKKIYGIDCPIFLTRNKVGFTVCGNYEKTIVFSYGLGCIMSDVFFFAKEFSENNKINVAIYDFPGCGVSEGTLTEESTIDALKEVIEETKSNFLMGFSLGTGVVLSYMERYKNPDIQKIILLAAFSSINRIVNGGIFTEMAIDSFSNLQFKNFYNISQIECEIIGIYSNSDELIGKEHGEKLKERNPILELFLIRDPGISHAAVVNYVSANFHNYKENFFNYRKLR